MAMSLEMFASNCAGFAYWVVEYGGKCYCGNSLDATSTLAAIGDVVSLVQARKRSTAVLGIGAVKTSVETNSISAVEQKEGDSLQALTSVVYCSAKTQHSHDALDVGDEVRGIKLLGMASIPAAWQLFRETAASCAYCGAGTK